VCVCVISINRDCDGPKNAVIIDEDGTLVGGSGGAILPRAEKFSEGSFFGLPFTDTVNKPYMQSTFVPSWENDSPAWYPNVPAVMWSTKQGQPIQMQTGPLSNGFGIARQGCTYMEKWNVWKCPTRFYNRCVCMSMHVRMRVRVRVHMHMCVFGVCAWGGGECVSLCVVSL